ncbi:reticulophagy regulator 3-like [Macrosteles quadrilineatus]|uniref:reticulophagy regulator 3-like n=1 Tax=Macrosteles quadrilineatus TaxID=74068 RepID=UPI0023E09D5C|nr:reticulophagy regulator 3-like [Macrosteles quadrilineatus]
MAAKTFFNRLKFWKRSVNEEHQEFSSEFLLANRLKIYEKYVNQIQRIVMWENPALSIVCILSINLLFWVFASLEWKFYGILSSLLLAMSAHEAWTSQVWPEISVAPSPVSEQERPSSTHPSVVAVSKALTSSCTTCKQCLAWLRNLRARQPGLFCCLSSVVCSALLLLGRTISGLMLVYAVVMSLLLGPGIFHRCVPPHLKLTVSQYITCINQAFVKYSNEASDDEYMPVTTSEDLALLTRVSDLQNDTYDSLTNPGSSSDMVSGLEIPSHEDDSLCDIDQQFLDQPDNTQQIEFQSGHFNGDSSSDEEAFTRDLIITEADERDTGHGLHTLIAQAVTSNVLGSVGLLASVVRQRRPTRRTDSDSDNEDDFEIINRDELRES